MLCFGTVVSTGKADTSLAVVKLAKEIDESAAVCRRLRHGAPDEVSRAKLGSFKDRSLDVSSCARTVCPFFRSALSLACCAIFL